MYVNADVCIHKWLTGFRRAEMEQQTHRAKTPALEMIAEFKATSPSKEIIRLSPAATGTPFKFRAPGPMVFELE